MNAELPSADRVYAGIVKADIPLWQAYHRTFLEPPHTDVQQESRERFKVLSLLSFPLGTVVHIDKSAYLGEAVWSYNIRADDMMNMIVHRHSGPDGSVCAPMVDFGGRRQWTYTHTPIRELEWRQWNRFHTLTRDTDSLLVAEHRPWVTFLPALEDDEDEEN